MLIGVRELGRGVRMQAGVGHPNSTHITLNCNANTHLGLKEPKYTEIGIYQSVPESQCR